MASSSYAGEDELDYEDEDYNRDVLNPEEHDEMMEMMQDEEEEGPVDEEEEGDYDDLYSDLNVGFFADPDAAETFDPAIPDGGFQSDHPLRQPETQALAAQMSQKEEEIHHGEDEKIRASQSQAHAQAQDLEYGKSTRPKAAVEEEEALLVRVMRGNAEKNVTILQEEGLASMKETEESLALDHHQQRSEPVAAVPHRLSPASPDHRLSPVGLEEGINSKNVSAPGFNIEGSDNILRGGADESTRQDATVTPWTGVSNGKAEFAANPASVFPSPMAAAGDKDSSSPAHYGPVRGSSRIGDGGNTRLLVTDLHWWTTDAELEAALSEYGRLKNLKFFEERASGKSKGYCQIEFYDAPAARACLERMNGRHFNGRPCVVSYSTPYTFRQLNAAHDGKTQQPQLYNQGRKTSIDTGGVRSGNTASQGGKIGTGVRNQGPGSGRTVQGTFKGRGGLGSRNMGAGGGAGTSGYGQGNVRTMAGPAILPQGMMAQGYDPTYGPAIGRGASAYGGYVPRAPAYAGLGLPYPAIGPGILPGIAPHVNPAFFGRGSNMNGMGMLTGNSMEGAGGWGETSLGGWVNEDRDQRIQENSYGEESGGSDMGHERGRLGSTREKGRDGERGSYGERRYREERDADWEREKPRERGRDRDREDDDYERERHARARNKPRSTDDDEPRSRPREEDYAKRRRMLR